jgi:hypothetical protein
MGRHDDAEFRRRRLIQIVSGLVASAAISVTAVAAHAQTPSYADGSRDRGVGEQWFAGQDRAMFRRHWLS